MGLRGAEHHVHIKPTYKSVAFWTRMLSQPVMVKSEERHSRDYTMFDSGIRLTPSVFGVLNIMYALSRRPNLWRSG